MGGQTTQERANRRALVLGGVAWNEMVYLDSLPDPRPQTAFARSFHRTVGSSGTGKALNLRRLGWDVTLWGVIGDDDDGRRISDRMEREGIEFLTAVDPAGTAHHVNLMDATGERISIHANSGTFDLDVDHDVIRPLLVDRDFVSVTIFNHCRGFLPILAEHGVPVWIDIHDYDGVNPYHEEFIEAASHLMLSSVAMVDWRAFAETRLESGTELVVCTHGDLGASALTSEGWFEVEATPAHLVDSNGAGDAFTAALATALIEGRTLDKALDRASVWAAQAVQSKELAPE